MPPMPLMEFEPTISVGERPQTYAVDRAATGTGSSIPVRTEIHLTYLRVLTEFQVLMLQINKCMSQDSAARIAQLV
jgi:hypothetical protein